MASELESHISFPRPASGSISSRNPSERPRIIRTQAPQDTLKQFWNHFNTKYPGKVFTVLPDNPYVRTKAASLSKGGVDKGYDGAKTYEQAREECEVAVHRIVQECQRVNQKYTDVHFDIEYDLKCGRRDYLDGLNTLDDYMRPKGVKRITDIFENPQFFVSGATANDVRQGRDGDCWLMAALSTLSNKGGLIDKICVARNEMVGVYGFVFHRDGEWQQCIVDDKLYLRAAEYDESVEERPVWDDINRKDTEEEYRKAYLTGSRALYFAQCSDENETWLPLLEKAYAKAHGDYSSIDGGFVGEALEDLTGGVTTELWSTNILDKEKFWKDELLNVNHEFLFGCGTGIFSNWLDPSYTGPPRERKGIAEHHAYSIMDAKEINGQRLLRLRNPWGKKEWNGAWSDGSEQWTPEWMQLLGHKFGNDGMFWISYDDLLHKYQHFDRTRLFGPEWAVTQQWTSVNVPWTADYHSTRFTINLTKRGPVVIVLTQLDRRYFRGLTGEYRFSLQFRLEREGEEDYTVRSQVSYAMTRSVSTDITLDPGTYSVLMKITAIRSRREYSPEEVVSQVAKVSSNKLLQIGLSYDLSHAKAYAQDEQRKKDLEQREEREKILRKQKRREQAEIMARKQWSKQKKLAARRKREELKAVKAQEKREEKQRKRMEAALSKSYHSRINGVPANSTPANGDNPSWAQYDADSEVGFSSPDIVQAPYDGVSIPNQGENEALKREVRNGDHIPLICVQREETNPQTNGMRISWNGSTPSVAKTENSYPKEDSDTDSFRDFEFDSEIDMPSDDEDDVDETFNKSSCPPARVPTSDLTFADMEEDSWNAVCVVGLRVYSHDPELSINVVRPRDFDMSDMEAALDRDDPASAATQRL